MSKTVSACGEDLARTQPRNTKGAHMDLRGSESGKRTATYTLRQGSFAVQARSVQSRLRGAELVEDQLARVPTLEEQQRA